MQISIFESISCNLGCNLIWRLRVKDEADSIFIEMTKILLKSLCLSYLYYMMKFVNDEKCIFKSADKSFLIFNVI